MATVEEIEQQKAVIEKPMEKAAKEKKKDDIKLVRQLGKQRGFKYNMLKDHLREGTKHAN